MRSVKEISDKKIDDVLVNNVKNSFRNCMNEEQYIKVTKKECPDR